MSRSARSPAAASAPSGPDSTISALTAALTQAGLASSHSSASRSVSWRAVGLGGEAAQAQRGE